MSCSYSWFPRSVGFLLIPTRFSTSSSKEVHRYIVPAGSATVLSSAEPTVTRPLPKLEAPKTADPFEKEASAPTDLSREIRIPTPPPSSRQRGLRREALRKSAIKVTSCFACVPWSRRTEAEERRIKPTLIKREVEHREVYELFGSDVQNTRETPLPKCYKCSSHPPVEMHSPPPPPMLQRQGARRGGAPRGRRISDTPTTSNRIRQPGLASNSDSGHDGRIDVCASRLDQSQVAWQPSGTAYADNAATVNCARMVPRTAMYGFPSLDTSTASFSPAVPELSPHSATQKSAPISPETPIMAGHSTQAMYRESNTSCAYTLPPSANATVDKHPNSLDAHQGFGMQRPSSLYELEGSTLGQQNADLVLLTRLEHPHTSNQWQSGFNTDIYWSDAEQVASPPDWQQLGSLPSPIPAFEEQASVGQGPFDCINDPVRTWEQQFHENQERAYDYQPAGSDNLGNPSHANAPLVFMHEYLEGGHDETDFNFSPPQASPAPKKTYPSIKCECCGKLFTGQYARGNMRRHASQKNPLKPRRDSSCHICKKTFNRSDAVRPHERRAHPDRQTQTNMPTRT